MDHGGERPPMPPATRVRLADQVVTILVDAMLDGRLPTGSLLPPERQLSSDLDVNRTSLRQAIARLEQMGIVESRQGRGTVVRDVAASTDPAVMAHLVVRDRHNMLTELFEVREAIGGLVGRLAARHATVADREELRAALGLVADASDATARQGRELAFFRRLVATTRNRPLVAMQEWVDRAYGDVAALFVDAFADAAPVVQGLEQVRAAVESGDEAAATRAMGAYATASASRLLAAVAPRTPHLSARSQNGAHP